jgi:hypothetical protein
MVTTGWSPVPCTVKVQSLAMPTARSLLITAHFASPNTMSVNERYDGTRAHLHVLQPFFDLAGRGTADKLSIAAAAAAGCLGREFVAAKYAMRWWVVVIRCWCLDERSQQEGTAPLMA